MTFPPSSVSADKSDERGLAGDHAAHHNQLATAINAVVSELGDSPSGGFASATARREALHVTPQDFGAVSDGITDDSAAFQQALDSLPATGGTLWVPAGSYALASTVNLAHNQRIIGAGGGTRLRYSGSAACISSQPSSLDFDERSAVERLRITGTDAGTAGLVVSDSHGFGVRSVVIDGFTSGVAVELRNASGWTEGVFLEDVHSRYNATGLRLFREGGGTDSFGWLRARGFIANIPDGGVGIDVCAATGSGAGLIYNAHLDVSMWFNGSNGVAFKVGAGSKIEATRIHAGLELISGSGVSAWQNQGVVRAYGAVVALGGTSSVPNGSLGDLRIEAWAGPTDGASGQDSSGATMHRFAAPTRTHTGQSDHVGGIGFYENVNHHGVWVAGYDGVQDAPVFAVLKIPFGASVGAGVPLLRVDADGTIRGSDGAGGLTVIHDPSA